MENLILAGAISMFALGCASAPARLDRALDWAPGNRERIETFIASQPRTPRPVAVFDWDNTIAKNDAGDAMMFWMVTHDLLKEPSSWRASSPFLTEDAIRALRGACEDSLTDARCKDTILSIYDEGKLAGGASAWLKTFDADFIEPAYAWAVALLSGYTPDEIRAIAAQAIAFATSQPVDAKLKIGTHEFDAGVKIYPQMKDLIAELQKAGFDVWIATASSQYVIEVFARQVGVAPDHVIGVRNAIDTGGRLLPRFEECGGTSDIITYRAGKRCWINKVVFGETDPHKQLYRRSPTAFAAGDSDTDVIFVRDASGLRLTINRNKPELMCLALANQDGKWLVNPMFIGPKARKADAYPCAKYGVPDQRE